MRGGRGGVPLLELREPSPVLLKEVVHVTLLRDLLVQAVAHFSYVIAVLPALVQALHT